MSRRIDQRLLFKSPLILKGFGATEEEMPGELCDVSATHFRAEFVRPLSTSKRYRFILNLPGSQSQLTGIAVVERAFPQGNPDLQSYVFAIETMPVAEQDQLIEVIELQSQQAGDRRQNPSLFQTDSRRAVDSVGAKHLETRVVITGIGVVSPNAIGREQFWEAIQAHKSGIGLLDAFDHTAFPIKIAGQVDNHEFDGAIPKRKASRMGRATLLGWLAARQAIKDGELDLSSINKDRVGVSMGTTLGALDWAFEQYASLQKGGYQTEHPYTVAAGSCNAISGEIAVDNELRGPSTTFSQGCSSASMSISYGLDLIRLGRADAMLVGGSDAPLNPTVFGAFVRSGILAKSIPWIGNGVITEEDCTGCVLSEGACVLLIESLEHARRRKAHIYGELRSSGMSSEGHHMLFPHPSGRGMAVAIRGAISAGNTTKDKIDLVMAHIAGMREGYNIELKLLRREFNSRFKDITVTNIKPFIGYTQGACGAFEVAAACLAFREPVNWITYGKPNVKKLANTALVNCIGFGGKNVALILSRYDN